MNFVDQIHSVLNFLAPAESKRVLDSRTREQFPSFARCDFVLGVRNVFKGENLCLLWRGSERVVKVRNNYFYHAEDLHIGGFC